MVMSTKNPLQLIINMQKSTFIHVLLYNIRICGFWKQSSNKYNSITQICTGSDKEPVAFFLFGKYNKNSILLTP